jgi:hypothetical protein
MQDKSLKPVLQSKPALACYYESAHKHILSKKCYVREKEFSTFEVFMDDLRDLDIGCRDYAYTVVTLLEKWLKDKKFYRIPIGVSCGDWALGKFQKVDKSSYVRITEPDEDLKVEILQSELLVARTYVASNLVDVCRMKEVVKDLKPLLSKVWLESSKEERPLDEVTEILCKEYGIKLVADYNAIIRRLQCRR